MYIHFGGTPCSYPRLSLKRKCHVKCVLEREWQFLVVRKNGACRTCEINLPKRYILQKSINTSEHMSEVKWCNRNYAIGI